MKMTKYELLQTLERLYPSPDEWFISDEDEGIVNICFVLDDDEEIDNED
jgi:hypothetical protein